MMPSGLRYDGDDGLLPREEGLRGTPDLPDVPYSSDCPAVDNDSTLAESVGIASLSQLLDQMVMDIQHLEIELVRTRYRLSFFLEAPYDDYMRMELFSGMGGRYRGSPAFDEYLRYRGFGEDEDAIDTPFHVSRMLRLAEGHDDYPDLYP